MKKDTPSRKWIIVINNPLEKGYTREYIKEIFQKTENIRYWCISDEVGEEGTPHTNIFIYFSKVARFSYIKKRFEGGHFEKGEGTSQEIRDYVFKLGKWEKHEKAKTLIKESCEEYGDIPLERKGVRNDLVDMVDEIKEGRLIVDIIEENPQHIGRIIQMEKFKQDLLYRDKRKESREVFVTYVHGKTRTGKTSGTLSKYAYEVYRVTNYENPFDRYNGEDVIVMDEFRSSLKLKDMLVYMEGYPNTWLPARYGDKLACYTKLYIISNWSLEKQYSEVQKKSDEDWQAFVSRINKRLFYTKEGVQEYEMKDGFVIIDCDEMPF